MNENKGKEVISNTNNQTNNPKPVKDNKDMKKKLMRMMLIVVSIF